MKKIKCILVGDEGVGKSELFKICTTHSFSPEFLNHFNNSTHNMLYEDIPISIEFWDADTKEDMYMLITNQFPQIDAFLLCFSVVSKQSLENILQIWEPKIKQYSYNSSLILIGCKKDLRDKNLKNDTNFIKEELEPIPTSRCIEIKNLIKAHDYIECSAYSRANIEKLLNLICRIFLNNISEK